MFVFIRIIRFIDSGFVDSKLGLKSDDQFSISTYEYSRIFKLGIIGLFWQKLMQKGMSVLVMYLRYIMIQKSEFVIGSDEKLEFICQDWI